MMKYINASFLLSIVLLSAGCKDSADQPGEGKVSSLSLDRIYLSVASDEERATPGTDSDFDENGVLITKFDDVSTLFISQGLYTRMPFYAKEYIYPFKYMGDEADASASWEEGYNFIASDPNKLLKWENIKETGTYNGGYALYALYYPTIDLEDWGKEDVLNFIVPRDQRVLEALKKADILGAYHNTDLFTRLRFRLYHLMVYLKVNLYVPVYDTEKKTGFTTNANPVLSIEGANDQFSISWALLRDSDGKPPVGSLPVEGDVDPFLAYAHPVEGDREVTKINYKEYTEIDQNISGDEDEVMLYEFSVIIPMQDTKFLSEKDSDELEIVKNFLKVEIKSPGTGFLKTYYLNRNQTIPDPNSQLSMESGHLQVLNLYLPRKGSSLVMMGATVDPWDDLYSEFPLIEQEAE